MKSFYHPNQEQLTRLEKSNWICSYSGGKDSTSLVTWMEWLRKSGWITNDTPKLVMSDTTVEYPFLKETCDGIMEVLKGYGWHCEIVVPKTKDKLYTLIFGRGVTPIDRAVRGMRWCTRATKVDPMTKYQKTLSDDALLLTGMRWGESSIRDEKMTKVGCVVGGECGVPGIGEGKYAPIVNWTDCQVYDWLMGGVDKKTRELLNELYPFTQRLMKVYGAKVSPIVPISGDPEVHMGRFGCIGCPAISINSGVTNIRNEAPDSERGIRELYGLWEECKDDRNRLVNRKPGKGFGPIKMEMRKILFEKFLKIQEKIGFKIVSDEDELFIRKCWEDEVYPRGWSKEDESRKVILKVGHENL